MVEGYVDVIAMVGAGFPASVAPLGTALTENQLVLLWRMADEPILCFDGDKAGQKAALRAADLALPHLKPGKSLRFALLPEGQDPDDLARSGGRGAIEEVIGAARGACRRDLVARDRGRRVCDAGAARGAGGAHRRTDQRHPRRGGAALLPPGSGGAPAAHCSRREGGRGGYGRGNFAGGAAATSAANQAAAFRPAASSFTPGAAGRIEPRGRAQASAASQTINRGPYQAASPQLALSPLMRGQRSAISRREALILQSLINHPWLLHDHLEEVAALELAHPEANKLRAAIIAAFASDHHHARSRTSRPRRCAPTSQARGFSEVLQRVERAITTQAVWGAQPGRGARGCSFHLAPARLLASPMALLT